MANPEHVEMLRDGVATWNRWRQKEPVTVADLSDANFSGANLSGVDLSAANLSDANLNGTNLRRANLREAQFRGAALAGASLRGANLSGANLIDVQGDDADFSWARLLGATLNFSRLKEAELRGARLLQAQLREVDLYRANLHEAEFDYADLYRANLSQTNLSNAHLYRANLYEANLDRSNLTKARLLGANLYHVTLTGANLAGANLTGANLSDTNLTGANLTGANLTGASSLQTNFTSATLTDCIVYGISAWGVTLEGAEQANIRITPTGKGASITVDNLEVAQFIYLLLHDAKVRAVLDTITSKLVLILGRFSPERKPTLDALREALRNHPNGYIPVLFDFLPQPERHILDTVKTLANLARFIIADVTDPHVVRTELALIVPSLPDVPVQPIVQRDAELPLEYTWWRKFPSVLPVYGYAELDHLLANLDESVISPVEGHVKARRL